MANSNFALLMDKLGYETDQLCGQFNLPDLIARCESYLSLAKQPGFATGRDETVDGFIINCAYSAERLILRVNELLELAQIAQQRGFVLYYC